MPAPCGVSLSVLLLAALKDASPQPHRRARRRMLLGELLLLAGKDGIEDVLEPGGAHQHGQEALLRDLHMARQLSLRPADDELALPMLIESGQRELEPQDGRTLAGKPAHPERLHLGISRDLPVLGVCERL